MSLLWSGKPSQSNRLVNWYWRKKRKQWSPRLGKYVDFTQTCEKFVCCLLFVLHTEASLFDFFKQLSTIYSLRHVNCKNFESIRAFSNVWRSIISFLGRKFVVKMQQCSVGLCTSSRTLLSHRSGKKQSFGSLQRFRKALNQQELIKGMFSDEKILMNHFFLLSFEGLEVRGSRHVSVWIDLKTYYFAVATIFNILN